MITHTALVKRNTYVMRKFSSIWLWANGGLFWYARHRERIGQPDGFDDLFAGPGGNIAGPIDFFFPFVAGFLLAFLIRAIYRKLTSSKASESTDKQSVANASTDRSSTNYNAGSTVSEPQPDSRISAGLTQECGECRHPVSVDAKFCPQCGTQFDDELVECFYCGAEIGSDAQFCESCGKQFSDSEIDNDEIRALRSEISAAENATRAAADLERLTEDAKQVSLQLAIAESELRTLNLRNEKELDGEKRIDFLKEKLSATEKVERLKSELRLAESRVAEAESISPSSAQPNPNKEPITKSELSLERDNRRAKQQNRRPKTRRLNAEETKQAEVDAAWQRRRNAPDGAWLSGGGSSSDTEKQAEASTKAQKIEQIRRLASLASKETEHPPKPKSDQERLAELDARIKKLRSQHDS